MFTGCGTALVTPFLEDLSLDEATLRRLVRRQIEAGINFLVPCGTTGREPHADARRAPAGGGDHARRSPAARVPVLAGAGGYNTHEVIELARELERMGADGILSVTPYYNKPTQEGLYQHYKAIAAAIRLPIVVYSVQGRTGVNVEPAHAGAPGEDREHRRGEGSLRQHLADGAMCSTKCPRDFTVLSGDDAITIPLIALGGRGIISVASNEIPAEMTEAGAGVPARRFRDGAREIQARYLPLMNVNFVESNPIPVKAAMALMGLLEPVWRLPMCPPSAANQAKIDKVLERCRPAGERAGCGLKSNAFSTRKAARIHGGAFRPVRAIPKTR